MLVGWSLFLFPFVDGLSCTSWQTSSSPFRCWSRLPRSCGASGGSTSIRWPRGWSPQRSQASAWSRFFAGTIRSTSFGPCCDSSAFGPARRSRVSRCPSPRARRPPRGPFSRCSSDLPSCGITIAGCCGRFRKRPGRDVSYLRLAHAVDGSDERQGAAHGIRTRALRPRTSWSALRVRSRRRPTAGGQRPRRRTPWTTPWRAPSPTPATRARVSSGGRPPGSTRNADARGVLCRHLADLRMQHKPPMAPGQMGDEQEDFECDLCNSSVSAIETMRVSRRGERIVGCPRCQ
jgi:hypothetical protein